MHGYLTATYAGKAVQQIGKGKKYKAPEEEAVFEPDDYWLFRYKKYDASYAGILLAAR